VAGDAVLEVDAEAGGRMSSLRIGGSEVLVTAAADPIGWGCYPMAPWAGRVGGAHLDWRGRRFGLEPTLPPHAIHGTVHRRSWDVVDDRTLRTDLGPGWPFGGEALQRFTLTPHSLVTHLSIHAGGDPFPATLGWHPWFRRVIDGDVAELSFSAGAMYERGSDHLPTGRLIEPSAGPWDDTFTDLGGPTTITWADRLRLRIDADLDHLVVYDAPDHALCVEPQSGPPDAFALGLASVVKLERPLGAEMRWSWATG
jgi:aldose 1-epimerase